MQLLLEVEVQVPPEQRLRQEQMAGTLPLVIH